MLLESSGSGLCITVRHFGILFNIFRKANDLRLVQILLRHARIETTTIYEHLSSKEAAEKGKYAVEKLFRKGDEMIKEVQIPAGNDVILWGHWDMGICQ